MTVIIIILINIITKLIGNREQCNKCISYTPASGIGLLAKVYSPLIIRIHLIIFWYDRATREHLYSPPIFPITTCEFPPSRWQAILLLAPGASRFLHVTSQLARLLGSYFVFENMSFTL